MEKNGSLQVGKTPCAVCGRSATHISKNGDPLCQSCDPAEKQAGSIGVNDTMDKAVSAHTEKT